MSARDKAARASLATVVAICWGIPLGRYLTYLRDWYRERSTS